MYGYDLSSYDFHFLPRLEKPGLTINSRKLGRIKFGRLNTLEYVVQQHLRVIEAAQDKISECVRNLERDDQFGYNHAADNLIYALNDYRSNLDLPRSQAESYLYLIKETMKKNTLAEYYTFSDTGDPLYME